MTIFRRLLIGFNMFGTKLETYGTPEKFVERVVRLSNSCSGHFPTILNNFTCGEIILPN